MSNSSIAARPKLLGINLDNPERKPLPSSQKLVLLIGLSTVLAIRQSYRESMTQIQESEFFK